MSGVCRAGCGVPLNPFAVDADGEGIHPLCWTEPEPVLPGLRVVLARHQQGMQRSRQRHLGPSQIGHPCDRHLAYRLADVPMVNDEGLKWAPLLGTWAHAGLAEAFAQENERLGRERYLIERRVELPSELVPSGACDLYDMDCGEAVDWKLVGKTSMLNYRRHGPSDAYRVQGHTYGLGWEAAGHEVRSVRIVFLPRWSHLLSDAYEWSEPYNRELAQAALARVAAIASIADAFEVADHPDRYALIHATPGDGCRFCPWHRQWPEDGPADLTGCPGA